MSESRRIVAIVGRPNVGKSAIFNRLVGRRIAIVHEQSGVTRDRLMHEAVWDEQRFDLIDTGGICSVERTEGLDAIQAGIRRQAECALAEAAAVVFVTDVVAGVAPLDEEVALLLRRQGSKAFVAANKADHEGLDGDALAFAELGFPVFPVSALHNRGFGALMEAVLGALPAAENRTEVDPLKVAVVGRPNVGKSSYINRILRSDRVIVSDVPGTTRDSIDVPFAIGSGPQARHYVLIDTAGIRRTGKIDNAVERFGRFRTETSIRRANVVVILLDAVTGPTEQDKHIAALVEKHRRGAVIVVNKWDLRQESERRLGPELRRLMPFMGHCPVVFVSSLTGYSIRRSVDAIDHVGAQVRARLPTGVLNRTVLDAIAQKPPPTQKGKSPRIYYATQVSTEPITVRLFVNSPRLVQAPYTRYIVRMIRTRFGLEGAPVVLQFRSHHPGEGSTTPAGRKTRARPVRKTRCRPES